MTERNQLDTFIKTHFCEITCDKVYPPDTRPLEDRLYDVFVSRSINGKEDLETVFKELVRIAQGNAGRTGSDRGNLFNSYVTEAVSRVVLPNKFRFTIQPKASIDKTVFDLVVTDVCFNKYLGIYTKVDLWGGGHQGESRVKLLGDAFHEQFGENVRVVTVICKKFDACPQSTKKITKVARELLVGFVKGRVAYITQIGTIFSEWFENVKTIDVSDKLSLADGSRADRILTN